MKKFEVSLQVGLIRHSDIGKEMTMRNANEHRRLVSHLKHLDSQLHNKLVSMDAEMMELRSSQYNMRKSISPQLCESRERANSDCGDQMRRDLALFRRSTTPSPYRNQRPRTQSYTSRNLVLPEINLENTSLVSRSASELSSRRGSDLDRPHSPTKQRQFLQIPSSVLLQRPSSLPDLRDVDGKCHLSPKTARQALQSAKTQQYYPEKQNKMSGKSQENLRNSSDDINVSKGGQHVGDENTDNRQLIVPKIKCENSDNNDDNTSDGSPVHDLFLNSMLTKATYADDDESELMEAPDLASLGFMDFNDVIDKRLQQLQDEPPDEAEMRKVTYLRWREKESEIDLVKEVFKK